MLASLYKVLNAVPVADRPTAWLHCAQSYSVVVVKCARLQESLAHFKVVLSNYLRLLGLAPDVTDAHSLYNMFCVVKKGT